MFATLPAAGPAVSPVHDYSLSCWADNESHSRCYGKAVTSLGLCREHLERLHDGEETAMTTQSDINATQIGISAAQILVAGMTVTPTVTALTETLAAAQKLAMQLTPTKEGA